MCTEGEGRLCCCAAMEGGEGKAVWRGGAKGSGKLSSDGTGAAEGWPYGSGVE